MALQARLFESADHQQGSALIARAFSRDPLFLYWCRRREPALRQQQFAMAEILNGLQAPGSGHSLGVFDDGRLLGLAYLKDSQSLKSMGGVLPLLADVVRGCGFAAMFRFVKVGAELPRHWPGQRHLYLSLLAVTPDSQGSGYGRALLRAVDECARKHGYSSVCLDTQNPDNVDYYRRQGYQVRAHVHIGRLESWCMAKQL